MDEIVRAAMAKWPKVPHCFGWLALDARGQWRMRDERCQALGLAGDTIRHASLISFINRNYLSDEQGCWYFQNGPQRVYVELESTPYILQMTASGWQTHTGMDFSAADGCYIDQEGQLYFSANAHIARLDDRDLNTAAARLCYRRQALDEASLEALLTLPANQLAPGYQYIDTAQNLCLDLHTCDLGWLLEQFRVQPSPKVWQAKQQTS